MLKERHKVEDLIELAVLTQEKDSRIAYRPRVEASDEAEKTATQLRSRLIEKKLKEVYPACS